MAGKSVNKVILVGYVAADPVSLASHPNSRVSFEVAVHCEYRSDGEKIEVTDYHRVVAWGRLGEICAKYLSKGQGVYVEGVLLNRGGGHFSTEIRANEVNMLTWRKRGGVENFSVVDVEVNKFGF